VYEALLTKETYMSERGAQILICIGGGRCTILKEAHKLSTREKRDLHVGLFCQKTPCNYKSLLSNEAHTRWIKVTCPVEEAYTLFLFVHIHVGLFCQKCLVHTGLFCQKSPIYIHFFDRETYMHMHAHQECRSPFQKSPVHVGLFCQKSPIYVGLLCH